MIREWLFKQNWFINILIRLKELIVPRQDIDWLVTRGLRLGRNVFIGSDVIIDPFFSWLVSIGDDSFLTSRVFILAHDASTKKHIGYSKIGRVSIGCKTFIGVGAIILPGVKIGDNAIIGAGSVVSHDIPDNSIAVGNPARVIGSTSDFVEKHKKFLNSRPIYQCEGRVLGDKMTDAERKRSLEQMRDEWGYVL